MSDNLARDLATGEHAFVGVGGRASWWHHLGQEINKEDAVWDEVYKLAHLDYDVYLKDLYSRVGNKTLKLDGYKGVWRDNGGAPVSLGVVGENYTPIQNKEAFDFVDAMLGVEGGAHYEAAGALGRGERIWVLARVPGADFHIPGTDDEHKSYLLVATSHDGSLAYTASLTDVRVVCQNTLRAALAGITARQALKIKHTINGKERLEEAKKLMAQVPKSAKELQQKLDTLAHRKMTKDNMLAVLERLFPGSTKAESTRQNNIVTRVLELFEANDGNAIPQIRGTAYNMLNAVTEYTDHFRGVRKTDARTGMSEDQIRAENSIFGTGDALKSQAVGVLLAETKDAPYHDFKKPVLSDGNWIKRMGITNLP